jgi:hypothetical protein
MPILGLHTTETHTSQRETNFRRSVQYTYPVGKASLTALLSLFGSEITNDPRFSWFEKRFRVIRSNLLAANTGPFFATGSTSDLSSPYSFAAGTAVRMVVADATVFSVGHTVLIQNLSINGSSTPGNLLGTVTAVFAPTANGGSGTVDFSGTPKHAITVVPRHALASVLNTSANLTANNSNCFVSIVGLEAAQGQVGASLTNYQVPVEIYNHTQIARNAVRVTGTALTTPLRYDTKGITPDLKKDALLEHMLGLEMSLLWGQRSSGLDPVTSLPKYTTGGILWYLSQYELTSNNPYGQAGATADSDYNKRYILNTAGSMTVKTYEDYLERLFSFCGGKTNERLVYCGTGFLRAVTDGYRNSTQLTAKQGSREETFGLTVVSHVTPFGIVHYQTHPLMSENPATRYSALFLDPGQLKYMHHTGRDTAYLIGRAPNNADYIEEEWLSEFGLKFQFPESAMYIAQLTSLLPV